MLRVIGTLREGASLESVEAAARAAPGRRARFERLRDALVREVRPAIAALMGAVVFLLFVACANVANLMLVRAWSRSREVAVRSALGASPARLVRLVAAEAVLLAGAGTLAGVALAAAVLDRLPAIASADLPRLDTIRIDWRVLAFAAFAGLAQALVFALAAAWRGARPDIMQTLRGGAHVLRPGAGSLARSGVVVAQVALSFVLLTGCGLMFRSYVALRRVDPGYEPRGLLTFLATGEARRVPPRRRAAFLRDIHERLRALPG